MWYPFCMKQHKGYRLSEEALRLLDVMAATNGISRTAVLEMAVRTEAKKQGIEIRADSGVQGPPQQRPATQD